ncbi:MAG: hypothetical protein ACK4HG_20040 [Agrobacterium albertimagni]
MTMKATTEGRRLQQELPKGDRQTIERQHVDEDDLQTLEEGPTEQGVALDPKRRID